MNVSYGKPLAIPLNRYICQQCLLRFRTGPVYPSGKDLLRYSGWRSQFRSLHARPDAHDEPGQKFGSPNALKSGESVIANGQVYSQSAQDQIQQRHKNRSPENKAHKILVKGVLHPNLSGSRPDSLKHRTARRGRRRQKDVQKSKGQVSPARQVSSKVRTVSSVRHRVRISTVKVSVKNLQPNKRRGSLRNGRSKGRFHYYVSRSSLPTIRKLASGRSWRLHHVKTTEKKVIPEVKNPGAKNPARMVRSEPKTKEDKRPKSPRKNARPKPHIQTIRAQHLALKAIPVQQSPVPKLSYGLERVLFNPGVYQLQDPRSRVFNFDPYLQKIMPVREFDFNALKEYITSSKDEALRDIARRHGKRYVGSTSSMTGILGHFHYLVSQWRPVNTGMLSKTFPAASHNFTELLRAPAAAFLKYNKGTYAIDADKQFDRANVLQLLGKSMEKLLVLSPIEYEKYRRSSTSKVSEAERSAPESYHYSTLGDFLMRSQLDAHDPRLPGSGMFDLKTRAVVSVRMDVANPQYGSGYQIKDELGAFESFEREYYDMIRAAFLKYSLQVRMGRMDGIFVAYHNTQRIFGFQYVSIDEMDLAIHGQRDTSLGDQEFALSIGLLNEALDRATKKFPKTTLRLYFETRDAATPFMYIFAEPVTDAEMEKVQSANSVAAEQFERNVLGNDPQIIPDQNEDAGWADMEASVQHTMEQDELGLDEHADPATLEPTEEELFPRTLKTSDTEGTDELSETHLTKNNHTLSGKETVAHSDEGRAVDALPNQRREADELSEGNGSNTTKETLDANVSSAEMFPKPCSHDSTNSEHPISEKLGQLTDVGEGGYPHVSKASPTQTSEETQPMSAAEKTSKAFSPSERSVSEKDAIQADVPFLAEINDKPENSGQVLAMTLTLRHKVNNTYVLRPQELKASDKWSIEYSLVEVPDEQRAWALYQACINRRKKKQEPATAEDADNVNYYVRNLRAISQQGASWRQGMDKLDNQRQIEVLGESLSSKDESSNDSDG